MEGGGRSNRFDSEVFFGAKLLYEPVCPSFSHSYTHVLSMYFFTLKFISIWKSYWKKPCPDSANVKVLLLDGSHVRSHICYLICVRPFFRFRAGTNWIFFLRKDLFSLMLAQYILSYHLIQVPWHMMMCRSNLNIARIIIFCWSWLS